MQRRILVIVVTYNGMQWIERCIASVVGSSVPADLVVVDNGSTDGTLEYLQGRREVRLIKSGENLGFGAANNIGLQIALDEGYDFVYLLNQDAWVEKDTLELLVRHWDPRFAVVSPAQRNADGTLEKKFAKYVGKGASCSGCDIVPLRMVNAAHWMISRDALLTVGGFSPAFHHYGEDDNWVDRARHFGLKTGWLPCADAVHDRTDRPAPKAKRMYLKCTGALVRLMNPCQPFWLRMTLFPIELCAMAAKNRSVEPLRYLAKTWRNVTSLAHLRGESLQSCAFLKK